MNPLDISYTAVARSFHSQTAVFPPKTICFGFEVQAHQTAAVAQVFPTHNLNTFGLIPSLLRNWIACWIASHLKTQSQGLPGYRLHTSVLKEWLKQYLAFFLSYQSCVSVKEIASRQKHHAAAAAAAAVTAAKLRAEEEADEQASAAGFSRQIGRCEFTGTHQVQMWTNYKLLLIWRVHFDNVGLLVQRRCTATLVAELTQEANRSYTFTCWLAAVELH
ncbi:TPA: hypothetical protein ACH3X3_010726 [Trebouxia sp. C0006]